MNTKCRVNLNDHFQNCDFSTIVEYKMRTHYSDVHGEVGSYVCELCNKGCKSAPQLKYHMKTVHPDDKTQMHYKCNECSKTFRHSCNLKVSFIHNPYTFNLHVIYE